MNTKKWFIGFSSAMIAGGMFLAACGDNSSSGGIDFDDSFEMVLYKQAFQYDEDDSTLKWIEPVCKVERPGNLMGPEDVDEWDTTSYKAFQKKGVVTIKNKEGSAQFDFEDGSFPNGLWAIDPDKRSKLLYYGYRLEDDELLKQVIHYDGNCLMKDFYSQLGKKNEAIEDMEKTFVHFYKLFLPSEKDYSEKNMLSDIRATDCDELSLFSGLITLKVSDFKESSGKISVSFNQRTCDVNFQIRYAYNQEDCEAAYDDFKIDSNAEKNFDFENYNFDVTYEGDDEEYCLDYLVIDLKKEKKIPTRTTLSSREFARGMVDLVIGGLK